MSAFERPKGSGRWVAKYQLHGEQVWVDGGPWFTKSAAREAERRDRDRRLARKTDETCASFGQRWLKEWRRPSDATHRTYARAVQVFTEEFGPTPLGEVERLTARTWALSQPSYIPKTIRTMYEDARNVGLVESNPFSQMRLRRTEAPGQIVPPSLEEYAALLRATSCLGGYREEFQAMLQFAAWTGVRAGELQALRWEDIGPDSIQIRRSRRRDGSEGMPKNGKAREIAYLPPAHLPADHPRREDDYVFHSPRGKALDTGSHFYAWREIRATAGLREIRWHDLRHFCATQLLEMGLDHFAVSVQLGHTDGGALVMSRYGHPSQDAARERLLAAFDVDASEIGSSTGSRRAS